MKEWINIHYLHAVGKESKGVISKAMLSIDKRSMQIQHRELCTVIERRAIPEHAQFRSTF